MSYSTSNKIKLLQSASALILGASAVTAHAQSVGTNGTDVTLASVNALVVVDQSVSADSGTTATANEAENASGNGVAVTNSSVSITGGLTNATAINNTASPSLNDSGSATTTTTSGISVEQDNLSSATAQIGSAVDGTDVKISTGATTSSPLTISGTVNRASATGNTASTAVSTTNFTTNETKATLGAMQQNTGAANAGAVINNISITATVKDTEINLTAGATTTSGLTVSGNTDAAVATANSLTQSMTLTGTTLKLGVVSAGAETVDDTSATGAALLSSRQTNTFTDVSAANTASAVTLVAGVTQSSSLNLTGNTQDATATGSTAGNVLALSGTTVGTGAAIVSTQTSDAESTVTAATTGQAGITATSLGATTATASSASLTDNALQSRATGGTVTNTLTAAGTTITLQAPDTSKAATISTATGNREGTVSGAYATLNDQLIAGSVTATTSATDAAAAGFTVSVAGAVSNGSSINNDRNAMTAQAQGAVAANTTILSVGGTLSQGTTAAGAIANAAVIANIQQLSDSANIAARVKTGATTVDPAMLTSVGGELSSSSVSTSNNKIQAFADGASATNALTASATTLTTAANTTGVPGSTAVAADAAFAVVNRQDSGDATVKAELNDPIPLRTEIVAATTSSSVTSTGNMQDAFATSNKATNSITLAATTLTSDGAVVNNQNSGAQVSSIIGADTAGVPGDVGVNAGVIVDFNNTISSSNIAVTGNMVRGSAISNVGTNTLIASATTLAGDGADAKATADADGTPADGELVAASGPLLTQADFSLGNSQTLDGTATSATGVYATYGVDVLFDKAVTGSQIAVSNNTQFGEALGNSATNRVELTAVQSGASGAGNDPTAALNNVQSGLTADIDATSEMSLYANMASSTSSVTLNGNSNTSLGVINNAGNTVSVSGLAVNGSTGLASVNVTTNATTADYALNNNQDASGLLTSTAKTTAYNFDRTDTTEPGTTGILNGSASLSRNTTTAEASSNRVTNSLAVSATDNGATAALGNEQLSGADVISTASSSTYKLELTTGVASTYAAKGSSVAVEGNTTTALARGNSALNALNYNVNVAYTGITDVASFTGTTVASAGAVVLNAQTNIGNVAANADSVVYAVKLAGTGTGIATDPVTAGSALNSSASLGNNTTSAVAFGNAATNTLTMATWSAGIPSSAISSNQVNGGTVQASATGVSFTMTPTGPASGSMFRNSGNSINAQAIGNSSVSTIGGGN